MDLLQLRSFVVVAEIGNMRRAASLLAVSQPALSTRIRRLEDELGWALFERESGGMRLTQRGARWLYHCKVLLERADATEEAARAIGRGALGRIDLGVTPIAALSFVPEAVRTFAARHPEQDVAITEGLSHDLEDAVAHRRLDIAIVHPPASRDDVVVREFAREKLLAVVPLNHSLSGSTTLSARELAGHHIISIRKDSGPKAHSRMLSYLRGDGEVITIEQRASTSISLIGLVAAGAGIALVVESLQCIARSDVRFIPLSDNPPELGFALCYRPDIPPMLQQAFSACLSTVMRSRT